MSYSSEESALVSDRWTIFMATLACLFLLVARVLPAIQHFNMLVSLWDVNFESRRNFLISCPSNG